MSAIVCYLIVSITIHIVANILENGAHSRELGIVVLTMNLGMLSTTPETVSESIVGIITISGLIVLILSTLDEETTTLILSGITGLILITETNSLLMLYLGLELIGLTFYILSARERKGIKSTEAGIKYFTLGALSSGILLLGITLNYATTGTTNIEIITGASATLIKIGLLFKLGAAPFHVWVPDVYEGSAIIITIFFAIVPKIAYLAVLMRIGSSEPDQLLILSGILSIIVGAIGALNQTKLKRMLAYSGIGHMGFILIGIGVGTYISYEATIIYMIIYIIMTINSFLLIMELNLHKIVEIRGLARRNGLIGITWGLGLMSIAGVPPLAGFYNKYLILKSAVENSLIAISIIAVVMSVVSSFYYVRLVRWMYFEDKTEVSIVLPKVSTRASIVLGVSTFGILTLMIYPSILLNITSPVVYLI